MTPHEVHHRIARTPTIGTVLLLSMVAVALIGILVLTNGI
jgi:hypothetical protein